MAEPHIVQRCSAPSEDELEMSTYTRNPLREEQKGDIDEYIPIGIVSTEERSGFAPALDRFCSSSKDVCLGKSVAEVEFHVSPDNGVSDRINPLVFLPDTIFRRIWDCSQGVILIYIAIMVPVRVAFNYPSAGIFFYLEFIIDIYFFVDLGLNFVTAQQDDDPDASLVTDIRKIAVRYACSWFVVDFVASIPVDLITSYATGSASCFDAPGGCQTEGSSGQLLKLVKLLRATRLLKLLRLTRLNRLLDRYSEQLIYYNSVIHILKFVGTLQFASHLFACLYGAVYDFEADGYVSVFSRYLSSYYWAVQTMTTVGYGDFPAKTIEEQLLAVLTMTFGGFMFSFLISNMSTLIASANPGQTRSEERMRLVLGYLSENKLPPDLAARVLAFYRKQNHSNAGKAVLDGLPYVLRSEVFDVMYKKIIKQAPLFENCPSRIINQVCTRLKPINFPQGRYIYHMGELSDEMFIVNTGEVALVNFKQAKLNQVTSLAGDYPDPSKHNVAAVFTQGNCFGEAALLGIVQRTEHVFSRTTTSLLSLSRSDWANFLLTYPQAGNDLLVLFLYRMYHFGNPMAVEAALHVLDLQRLQNDGVMVDDWMEQLRKLDFDDGGCLNPAVMEERAWKTPIFFAPDEERKQATADLFKSKLESKSTDFGELKQSRTNSDPPTSLEPVNEPSSLGGATKTRWSDIQRSIKGSPHAAEDKWISTVGSAGSDVFRNAISHQDMFGDSSAMFRSDDDSIQQGQCLRQLYSNQQKLRHQIVNLENQLEKQVGALQSDVSAVIRKLDDILDRTKPSILHD